MEDLTKKMEQKANELADTSLSEEKRKQKEQEMQELDAKTKDLDKRIREHEKKITQEEHEMQNSVPASDGPRGEISGESSAPSVGDDVDQELQQRFEEDVKQV